MYTLAIEAANKTLSVAVLKENSVICEEVMSDMLQHSVHLAPMVQRVCQTAQIKPSDLRDIIVSNGPGSYTGLRIGVTFAKTLAYTLNIPLYSISSLQVLAHEWTRKQKNQGQLIVPFFDARRHNVYAGFYVNGQSVLPDQHCAFETVLDYCRQLNQSVVFVSPDMSVFESLIAQGNLPNNVQCMRLNPSATSVGELLTLAQLVDPHTHVPTYLKLAEAEEKWLEQAVEQDKTNFVERGAF